MSDQENPPSKQTSSVPLKKETVRVTLKAADAPKASPTGAPPAPAAPKPTAAAPKPPAPSAPKPPTATAPGGAPPAPSAPGGGAPSAPAPAPTIQLKTAPANAPGAPAPTIKLNTPGTAPAQPGAPTAPAGGAPAGGAPGAPGPTVALPKATVQLNPPTQPLGSSAAPASQMATMKVSEEESSTGNEGIVNVLAILGFLGAAAVIALQLMTSAVWLGTDSDGQEQPVEWGNLF